MADTAAAAATALAQDEPIYKIVSCRGTCPRSLRILTYHFIIIVPYCPHLSVMSLCGRCKLVRCPEAFTGSLACQLWLIFGIAIRLAHQLEEGIPVRLSCLRILACHSLIGDSGLWSCRYIWRSKFTVVSALYVLLRYFEFIRSAITIYLANTMVP
ncbi:hypothetical protein P389DRAFT_44427 [Cystobasidium minutum MCA 4210]|uniref:uncharacterized protein n=1 Tax=Cystobasidium minutum MCA 4210 TaxID=1397322 RepID=UPI0034CEC1B4|eukprot:jgi/Rhomi1/44427/CE44426_70